MFCPQCGQQQVSDVTRYCSRCGFPLDGVATNWHRVEQFPHVTFNLAIRNHHREPKEFVKVRCDASTILVVPIVAILTVNL